MKYETQLASSMLVAFLLLMTAGFVSAQQDQPVPDDYEGLLVKNDITAIMRGGDLEITAIVMDERIIRYATKELRDYFHKLIQDYLANNFSYNPQDPNCPIPVLVNFRALGQENRFEPHELIIYNYGQEYKPIDIIPVSPKFDERVVYIRQPPVGAIYLFDRRIDLNSDVIFSYFDSLRFTNWLKVIEAVNAAKAQLELYRARSEKK